MAEEATLQGSAEAAQSASTPTPPTATQSPAESQSQGSIDLGGGFTNEDFSHPQYGTKAKNLYKGFQEATTERNKAKSELDQIVNLIKSEPSLRKAFEDYANRSEGPSESEEEPDDRLEQAKMKLEINQALAKVHTHLGKGDPYKGKEIWDQEYRDAIHNWLETFNSGSIEDQIRTAMEYIALKKGPQTQNTQPAAPKPDEKVLDSGETDRGTTGSGPLPPSKGLEDDIQRMVRDLGYSSFSDFAKSAGAF